MIAAAVERVLREDRGRCLAILTARIGDLGQAEEALQEAAASALVHWGRAGLPDAPRAWLLRVALRKEIDRLRKANRQSRHAAAIAALADEEAMAPDPESIPDDRLRLIFACCHPALEEKTRVALTLRSLCGLSTAQVAAVFLDTDPAMGQRLSRAKAKIAAARIPFAIPGAADLPARLNSVLIVVYLIFTAGYAQGPAIGADLCDEAIFLSRLLVALAPDQPEVEGALALLLFTHARRHARVKDGQTVALPEQDRGVWDHPMLVEAYRTLDRALARRTPGPFQIKAAIAALHCETATDWHQIAALYARLLQHEPTPVVRLSHAVALAETGDLPQALDRAAALSQELADYQPWHAVMADLLARAGHTDAARAAYGRAIALAASPPDRAFLRARLAGLD